MNTTTLATAIKYLRQGDWGNSHNLVQDERSSAANWLHAILHRVEGDHDNAAYWYRKAGREAQSNDPMSELAQLEAIHLKP